MPSLARLREYHPYGTFIPKGCRSMIIGSFPIGKFSNPKRRHEIKENEFDFFFGGATNLLWRLLGDTFGVKLNSKIEIVKFLNTQKIGIGDVINSCVRRDGKGSDRDLLDIEWNAGLLENIRQHKIQKLYFTSRGVEKWFFRLFPDAEVETVTLLSPSAQSARSLWSNPSFQIWRKINPDASTYQFILKSYQSAFKRT